MDLLAMGGETILERVDGDGVHGEFMGGSEDTDSDFLGMDGLKGLGKGSGGRTPRLATRILGKGPLCPAPFLLMDWMECTGVPGALGKAEKLPKRGGWRVAMVVVEREKCR
jgi:hypothetical protein